MTVAAVEQEESREANKVLYCNEIIADEYFELKSNSNYYQTTIEKITDLKKAKTLLGSRVKWGRYDDDSHQVVDDEDGNVAIEMTFANGKRYVDEERDGNLSFIPKKIS